MSILSVTPRIIEEIRGRLTQLPSTRTQTVTCIHAFHSLRSMTVDIPCGSECILGVRRNHHMSPDATSRLQDAIETVEALPADDQELLVDLVRRRLIQQRRTELAGDIAESRRAYQEGEVRRGTVAELMRELAD